METQLNLDIWSFCLYFHCWFSAGWFPLVSLDHIDTVLFIFFSLCYYTPINAQYSLLLLKNSHYIWMSLFWLHSAEHQPLQSSAFMTLSCHQLDLIWSAPSPATRSDRAVEPSGGGMWPLSNSLIKAVIRPNLWLPNELRSEPGVPNSSGGWNFLCTWTSSRCFWVRDDGIDKVSQGKFYECILFYFDICLKNDSVIFIRRSSTWWLMNTRCWCRNIFQNCSFLNKLLTEWFILDSLFFLRRILTQFKPVQRSLQYFFFLLRWVPAVFLSGCVQPPPISVQSRRKMSANLVSCKTFCFLAFCFLLRAFGDPDEC